MVRSVAESVASLTLGRYSQVLTGHFTSTGSVAESIINGGLNVTIRLGNVQNNTKPEYHGNGGGGGGRVG